MLNNLVLNTGKIINFNFISNTAPYNISLYTSEDSPTDPTDVATLGTLTFNLKSNTNAVWLNGSLGYTLNISPDYTHNNPIGPLYIILTKNGTRYQDIIYELPIQYFSHYSLPSTIPDSGISITQFASFDWIDTPPIITNACNLQVTYDLIIYIDTTLDTNVSYNLSKDTSPITFKAIEIQQ